MRVTLVSWSSPADADPRRLIVLAVKTSQGKLSHDTLPHYLRDYPEKDVRGWILESANFPSVLEHVSFTFLIEGISRVTSHQLVRHRIASYTQESQRYSEAGRDYVVPESVVAGGFEEKFRDLVENSFKLYVEMVKAGIPMEDARYILPQAVTTRILMTVNLRELLHIACLRLSEKAQWEIRELVREMINEASKIVPEIYNLLTALCSEK
ncbi:MAG: FAD-dependent thymidylate synthase [Sulfolobales archaeon]|nr:FAD-dependent thymidylate synthase [Sulfolobales archaeon]MDW8010077.1 FAD-dependent thymidylate synthase [Sulfolobales archaeon]